MATLKETVIQAVRTYLKAYADSIALTDSQVIPVDDKGTRPALPYLTVSASNVGTDAHDEVLDTLVATVPNKYVRGRRSVNVTIDGYGLETEAWMEKASGDYILPNQQQTMRDLDLTMWPNGDIIDVSTLRDTGIESHFVQDWVVDLIYTSDNQQQTELLTVQTEITADDLVAETTVTL